MHSRKICITDEHFGWGPLLVRTALQWPSSSSLCRSVVASDSDGDRAPRFRTTARHEYARPLMSHKADCKTPANLAKKMSTFAKLPTSSAGKQTRQRRGSITHSLVLAQ